MMYQENAGRPTRTIIQRFGEAVARVYNPGDFDIREDPENRILPDPDIIERLPKELSDKTKAVGHRFAEAETAHFKSIVGGLGDDVRNLRAIFAMARRAPERKISVSTRLRNSNYLNTPDNVSFDSGFGDMSAMLNGGSLIPTIALVDDKLRDECTLDFTPTIGMVDHPDDLRTHGVAAMDLRNFMFAHLIGFPIAYTDLYEPIVKVGPDDLPPVKYDMLIAPDATGRRVLMSHTGTGNLRSIKSFTESQWGHVFENMRRNGYMGHLGIIESDPSSHDYPRAVMNAARRQGFSVSRVDTEKNIDKLIEAILAARVFVGMDTGPTHVAIDVVRAAAKVGRHISLRQVFNTQAFNERVFRLDLAGLHDARVFNYVGQRRSIRQKRESWFFVDAETASRRMNEKDDMVHLPVSEVAKFIIT